MQKISPKIFSWLPEDEIEEAALQQLRNVSEMPFIFDHVAVMPDCHLGKGATVGSVIATKGAIIPAAVGVDIGCGMCAAKLNITASQLPDSLESIRLGIKRRIPTRRHHNSTLTISALDRASVLAAHKPDLQDDSWYTQLGSLGGGNHFIEICIDESDNVWVVLHSGSRGVGNKLAQKHIKIAQKLCDDFFIPLVDKDLAYLPEQTAEFKDYMRDLMWAQEFARLNREEMMDRVMQELPFAYEVERVNCHHNYTCKENHMGHNVWITRKGAIAARTGLPGIIPGSMGTSSYIVSGYGNVPSFASAPHGAGRRFSRTEARRRLNMQDYDREMAGIECRRSESLIDELPSAYKDINHVMDLSRDLVRIDHTLKQVLNIKGD